MGEQKKDIAFPFAPTGARKGEPTPMPEDMPTPPPPELERRRAEAPGAVPRVPLHGSGDRIPLADTRRIAPEQREPLREIGPYVVYEELARGGMGAVFMGEDPGLGRKVALKLMARELIDDQDAIVRFQREARATAAIVHPNVAMIYLVGLADDGSPFLAMEFIGGGTLERLIRERVRLPYSRVADIMIQSCEALRAAYKQGIAHRDIKPANIMLTEDWTVKVVDFGLAKFFREESYRTVAGMVMGTPRYMSPEQSQGREADYRTDVYSLGATFYHLLAGKPPFDGDSPTQIMMKHVTSPIVPMRSINPEVPMEFDDIIRKCLMKDPNDRYQDYADLITDLARIKLQWTARERGSMVESLNDLPTMRLGADGQPLAPGRSGNTVASRSIRPSAAEEEHAPVPMWRWFAIGGAVVALLGGLLYAVFAPGPPPPAPPPPQDAATTRKSGFQVLLESIAAGQSAGTRDPGGAPINKNFVNYRATQQILRDLKQALLTHEVEKGEKAPGLIELVESGATVENFPMDDRRHPLDAWGNPIEYDRTDQILSSGGIDGRLNTEDDIVIGAEGEITIRDSATYETLEREEERRQAGGK